MSNSDNPRIGSEFQRRVREWFASEYNMPFDLEVQIPIGSKLLDPAQYLYQIMHIQFRRHRLRNSL